MCDNDDKIKNHFDSNLKSSETTTDGSIIDEKLSQMLLRNIIIN